jgi:predicted ATPase/tRNA A-37 threonylcarbamoyl transferase component Bud32
MNLQLGQLLLHYRLEQELGAGAMGVVYKAFDTKLERSVALKFLKPDLLKNPIVLARFSNEAKAISKLNHNNIGVVYNVEEAPQGSFIVMAFYEGETLAQLLKSGALELATAIRFALELAAGIHHAHQQGVIHRDIKPANIIITKDSQIKILDFGLSKITETKSVVAGDLTEFGKIIGTPLYACPEQLKGSHAPTVLYDIWAWGCVVYEMLVGRAPFYSDSLSTTILNVLSNQPQPLQDLRPDVPATLLEVVEGCLKKDPEQRVQSAITLINSLKPMLTELEPVSLNLLQAHSKFERQILGSLGEHLEYERLLVPQTQGYFFGRSEQIVQIIRLFQSKVYRLLSLVGLGGVGKTRLALEVAKQVQHLYRDGVAFVDLTKTSDPNMLPVMVLDALHVHTKEESVEAMFGALKHREMLLVLDNFEHVMSARAFVLKILQHAPKIHILITSRERLRMQAEMVLVVHGLEISHNKDLQAEPAAQLFVESAKRNSSTFELQPQDEPLLRQLILMLGGSPLGLNLAAAWTSVLSLSEIIQELETSLDLLATDAPDVPLRHRSFVAVFESSWNLLSAKEQTVLAKLTVFRGGCDRTWAQLVADASLPLLEGLLHKNLIYRTENRFYVYELIRESVMRRIDATTHLETMKELGKCCLQLAHQFYQHCYDEHHLGWLQRVRAELDNLRAILSWFAHQDTEAGATLFYKLERFWNGIGLHVEACDWGELFLEAVCNVKNFQVLQTQVALASEIGNVDYALEKNEILFSYAQQLQDRYFLALAHQWRGWLHGYTDFGSETQRKHLQFAVLEFKALGQLPQLIKAMIYLGTSYYNHPEALLYLREALALAEKCKSQSLEANAALSLAQALAYENKFLEARQYANQAHPIVQSFNGVLGQAYAYLISGIIFDRSKNLTEAKANYIEALKNFYKAQDKFRAARTLCSIGQINIALGNYHSGIRLYASGWSQLVKLGQIRQLSNFGLGQKEVDTWQQNSQLAPFEIDLLINQGGKMTADEAINYAIITSQALPKS